MSDTTTAVGVVNQAIQLIGNDQPPVTGSYPNFDSSPAGQAAAQLYGPAVRTVARQFGWDFARNFVVLTATGNTPPVGWSYEYGYPQFGVEILQLMPPTIADPNNPLPLEWNIGSAPLSSVPTKVIWTNQAGTLAVFTNAQLNNPATWDPLFREAAVRLLASEMAVAVAGKQDTGRDLLGQAGEFTQNGAGRPD